MNYDRNPLKILRIPCLGCLIWCCWLSTAVRSESSTMNSESSSWPLVVPPTVKKATKQLQNNREVNIFLLGLFQLVTDTFCSFVFLLLYFLCLMYSSIDHFCGWMELRRRNNSRICTRPFIWFSLDPTWLIIEFHKRSLEGICIYNGDAYV